MFTTIIIDPNGVVTRVQTQNPTGIASKREIVREINRTKEEKK